MIDFRHVVDQFLDLLGVADTRHNIFTLGIHQVFTHHFLIAGGRVAGEGHAGAGVIAHVPEDHRHDIDGSAEIIGDVGGFAVIHGALAHPRFEHGLGGQFHLLVDILGEIRLDMLLVDFLEGADHRFPILGGHLGIELVALLGLIFSHRVLEDLVIQVEDGGAEHFNQAAIRIPYEAGIPGQLDHAFHTLSVRPMLRMVFIMPGMENLAPERQETSSGLVGSPNFLPACFSVTLRAASI